ncbi:MAG: MGMT family protein, partial [Candidatus Omnitrophica bacterium]|nr:MGMT family protein [Candidatus Omnitrophota bacterium]
RSWRDLAAGGPRFSSREINYSACSKHQRLVSRAAGSIPFGKVTSYKGLARLAGTKSARAAGNALAD